MYYLSSYYSPFLLLLLVILRIGSAHKVGFHATLVIAIVVLNVERTVSAFTHHFALVHVADEAAIIPAVDVQLSELPVFHQRYARFPSSRVADDLGGHVRLQTPRVARDGIDAGDVSFNRSSCLVRKAVER